MLLCHVSDTHGCFPDLPKEAEIIIHSGDLCPNLTRGNREIEIPYQSNWVRKKSATFRDWIGDRPFLFCRGNHDFAPMICEILVKNGIKAVDLTSKKVYVKDFSFYGFPFIPYISGEWNCECFVDQMQREVRRLKDILESGIDILVAHAPIAGVLDFWENGHYGNQQMSDLFSYQLDQKFWPKAYLHGHIHTDASDQKDRVDHLEEMLISNAGTKVNLLEVK